MPTKCCAFGCTSDSSKLMNVSFHRFPSNIYWLNKWRAALRIDGKFKYSAARVCSLHFSEHHYFESGSRSLKPRAVPDMRLPSLTKKRKRSASPVPTTLVNATVEKLDDEEIQWADLEDPLAIPEEETNSLNEALSYRHDEPHYCYRNKGKYSVDRNSTQTTSYDDSDNTYTLNESNFTIPDDGGALEDEDDYEQSDSFVFDATNNDNNETSKEHSPIADLQGIIQVKNLKESELKYLTGHSRAEFNFIYEFVLEGRTIPDWPYYSLPLQEQLLMTLMKYRLNSDFFLLSIIFKTHHSTVSRIFKFWTKLLFETFDAVDFWSMRAKADHLYTVILDCTEITIEKPTSPEEQQMTWSSYKNCNTFKALVGIDEVGTVTYVSTLYGGAATDDTIVQKSGFLDLLVEGDFILADRGFEATDALAEKGVVLNKPPKKKGPQMVESDVSLTRAVASRRVDVERVIGLAKKNRILTQKVPHHMFELMPKIFRLLFMLVNLKPSICKKKTDGICNCKPTSLTVN